MPTAVSSYPLATQRFPRTTTPPLHGPHIQACSSCTMYSTVPTGLVASPLPPACSSPATCLAAAYRDALERCCRHTGWLLAESTACSGAPLLCDGLPNNIAGPATTSGAMYSTVPTGLMASSCFMLMVRPKSPSLTRPSPSRKMFSSLMSLQGRNREAPAVHSSSALTLEEHQAKEVVSPVGRSGAEKPQQDCVLQLAPISGVLRLDNPPHIGIGRKQIICSWHAALHPRTVSHGRKATICE